MSKFNIENFLKDMDCTELLMQIHDKNDTNEKYSLLNDFLTSNINLHAPYKTLSKKERKAKQKPWISKGILTSIKIKNSIYGKFMQTKNNFFYRRYKLYRDKINHLIRRNKRDYYKTYFSNNFGNMKKLWTGVNKIINKKSKKTLQIFV